MLNLMQYLQQAQPQSPQQPYWMTPPINPVAQQGSSYTDPNFLMQMLRGQGQTGRQSYGMPSFAGQNRNYGQISPWEQQNRTQMSYQPGTDYGNTPNPINYTGLFSMINPFYGSPRANTAMPTPRAPAAMWGIRQSAPGGPQDQWKQSLMQSMPGVMETMDMNRTLTDWWPGAGPDFTRSG